MLSKTEIQFYKLALERKLVTAEQVNRAIQLMKKSSSTGEVTPLVEIMVREKLLTQAQADELVTAPPPPGEPASESSAPPPQRLPSEAAAAAKEGPLPGTDASRATLGVRGPGASSPTLGGAVVAGQGLGPEARVFGKYEVLGEIARGGMGIVYKVRPVGFDRVLAMKVILSGPSADEEERRRFVREAEVISRLRHPNIITVHDVGSVGEQYYYTMDYIEGKTLDVLQKEGLPTRRALEIIRDVADAMAHANGKGVVHRDLKPRNIIVDERGVPIVMDFGLAKSFDRGAKLTRSGATLGTPAYMSPEQAGGDLSHVDGRTDVYALGSILYEVLSGRPPYTGETAMEILVQLMSTDARPLKELVPTLHRDIETICMRAIEKDLSRRYQTAGHLRDDLDRYLKGDSIVARPPGAVTIALRRVRKHRASFATVTVLLACLSVFLVWRQHEQARSNAAKAHAEAKSEVVRAEALLTQGHLAEAEEACDRAVALDPASVDALLARSRCRRAAGRYDLARKDAEAAVALAPASAGASEELANVALARGDPAEALKDYEKALAIDASFAPARIGRARAFLAQGNGEAARHAAEDALAHDLPPELAAAAAVLKGKALEELGDPAGAHTCYSAAASASPRCVDALLADGTLFASERAFEKAIDAFTRAIRADYDLAAAYAGRGEAYYRNLHFDDGVQDLNDALARDRTSVRTLVLLGNVYASKGNAAQAEKFLQEAVRLAPDDPSALVSRGRHALAAGKLDDAERFLRHAVERAPGDPAALDALGRLLLARSDWNSARELFARSIEIDSSDAEALGDLAWCELQLEDAARAKVDFERCRHTVGPRADEAQWYVELGDRLVLEARKKPLVKSYYEPALRAYAFAVERNARLAEAHLKQAEVQFLFGDFDEAKAAYDLAIAADPFYAPAYLGRAALWRDHMRPRSRDKAIADVERVLAFAPTDGGALTLRAEIRLDGEEWEAALADAEQVLAAQPGFPRAQRVRALALVKLGRAAPVDDPPPIHTAGNRDRALAHETLGEKCLSEQRFDEAILEFTRAIEEDPTYAYAYYGRAAADYSAMKAPEAIMDYGRAIELDPRLEMKYLSNFPKIRPLAVMGWAGLRPKLDKMIPEEQPETGVHLAYGFLLLEMGEKERARKHMGRALALRPDFALCHSGMGILLLREGKEEEAEAELRKCISIDPRLVSGHLFLAERFARAGKRDETLAELHTAVNLGMEDYVYVTQNSAYAFLKDDAEFRALLNLK